MNGKRILQLACLCLAIVACVTVFAGTSFADPYGTNHNFNFNHHNFNNHNFNFNNGYGYDLRSFRRFSYSYADPSYGCQPVPVPAPVPAFQSADYGDCGNTLSAASYGIRTVRLNGFPVALTQYSPYDVALSINGHASSQFFVDRRGNVFRLSNNGGLYRLGDLRLNGVNAFTYNAGNAVHVPLNQRAKFISGGLSLLKGNLRKVFK